MHTPYVNQLIDTLPHVEQKRFLASCMHVELNSGDVLCKRGDYIRYVFFPIECHISLMMSLYNRATLEVALIGNEGMYGSTLVLGVDIAPLHAFVQKGGTAWRMDAAKFCRELRLSPHLLQCLNRYIHIRSYQLAQLAACNRYHVVETRLARRLLMTQDRSGTDELHLTQEFISKALGVRRVGITKAASALQKRKLIKYNRGVITIVDRQGLEDAACECYRADRASYTQAFTRDTPLHSDGLIKEKARHRA